MTSFTIRLSETPIYREQLRQLAVQRKTSVGQLVVDALNAAYGKELATLYPAAYSLLSGGHNDNHNSDAQPTKSKRGKRP